MSYFTHKQFKLKLNASRWQVSRDGDLSANALYRRHYSAHIYKNKAPTRFAGPGEKIVLILPECDGLFVWRKFKPMDGQEGINCAVFRNESKHKSSELILEAESFAVKKWGAFRSYTYVNSSKIKSSNPGFCFKVAGYKQCGKTKGGLLVFEKYVSMH